MRIESKKSLTKELSSEALNIFVSLVRKKKKKVFKTFNSNQ
jgi:hypothetical protein